jgi:Mn2+/Fe2+ NRAMP family transporter
MKRLLEIALGMVTGIGGFLEAGSIATAAQAGADFGYQLLWAIALGTFSLIVLLEMSGRLALVSQRTLAEAMRERFGIRYFVIPLGVGLLVSLLVLASEVGGVALAIEMVTGVRYTWWAVPVAFVAWVALWKGTFGKLEKGTAFLGLVSVAIALAAQRMHPDWSRVGAGLLPTSPNDQRAHYWFLAVSILGASISPYLYYFYSSGAIEEKWDIEFLNTNRLTAALGNALGGALAAAVLVVAVLAFRTRGVHVDRFEQLGLLLVPALGRTGFACMVAAVAINCFGATVEIALSCAYLLAQAFGWEWKEDAKPREHARFSLVYSAAMLFAALPAALGVDILKLTNFSMALTSASLPVTVLPMLVLMNDSRYLHRHRNGWLTNAALGAVAILSIVLLVVSLPLQLLGGG